MAVDLTQAERRQMGDRLRSARNAADLSIREVAEAVGNSLTAAWSWERYGYLPAPATRTALAALYGIPESALFAEVAEHLAPALALRKPRAAAS
jgi:transcriptional regulator with XRE-family HTH domain